jgi:hypothetical protein
MISVANMSFVNENIHRSIVFYAIAIYLANLITLGLLGKKKAS